MKTSTNRISRGVICGLALLVFPELPAFAQLYTGSLTGRVLDPSGAPVPDAKIALDDVDRGTRNKTDRSGRYLFPSLSPGVQLDPLFWQTLWFRLSVVAVCVDAFWRGEAPDQSVRDAGGCRAAIA
ncbi:MAG TPA: carboxypeptidase-like regulatory domain-containing protein [Bryobacteraceae bacterium]|nr:carboxypeptidase-like regulatory domain-containing protein [Bryobacteraceae bacterium]